MTKKSLALGALAFSLGIAVIATSCRKNKDTNTSEDTGYTTEQFTADKTYDDVENIADQASTVASGGNVGYKTTQLTAGSCATVTHSTGSMVIDFGTTNCLCADGRYRRGKILVSYTGAYADSGSVHTITFDNFYQNDNKIEGTKTVTNMGTNASGQPYFSVVVAGTITRSTGGVITHSSSRTRIWVAGYTTLGDRTDDVYNVYGAGSITRPSGAVVASSVSAASPLVFAAGCRWIEAGTITFTMSSGLVRSLNYGATPTCDDQAILTLPSGVTYTITLP